MNRTRWEALEIRSETCTSAISLCMQELTVRPFLKEDFLGREGLAWKRVKKAKERSAGSALPRRTIDKRSSDLTVAARECLR